MGRFVGEAVRLGELLDGRLVGDVGDPGPAGGRGVGGDLGEPKAIVKSSGARSTVEVSWLRVLAPLDSCPRGS